MKIEPDKLPVMASHCKTCPFRPNESGQYQDMHLANEVIKRTLFKAHQICHGTEGKNRKPNNRCKGAFDHNREIYKRMGLEDPSAVDIEDLIVYHNGIVKEAPLKNCDGRLIMKNGRSIVTVNSDIEYPQKKRFVLAHELGHIILHADKDASFIDDDSTIEAYKNGPQETEANSFASELLMPEELFRSFCLKKKLLLI